MAAALERFPASADYSFLWGRLLAAAAPSMPRLAAEVAADRAPPLVELTAALAAVRGLAPVLADGCSSSAEAEGDLPSEVAPCAEPWAAGQRLGSRLLGSVIGALAAPRCSEPSRTSILASLESILDMPDPLPAQILGPHMPALLTGLQTIVSAVWEDAGRRATAPRKGAAATARGSAGAKAAPTRHTATRALAILEVVGSRAATWEAGVQLTEALLPLLQPREGSR